MDLTSKMLKSKNFNVNDVTELNLMSRALNLKKFNTPKLNLMSRALNLKNLTLQS